MKTLIKIFYLVLFLTVTSVPAQVKPTYVENYKCIETYLKLQGRNITERNILIKEKEDNLQTLRIFIGDTGIVHNDENYSPKLYNKKHWEKLYKTYSNDTIVKYWKTNDFPSINFILENAKEANRDGLSNKYPRSIKEIICISEPLYYMDNKYIIFFYKRGDIGYYPFAHNKIVIMKKEKGKWIVVEEIKDYLTSM